MSVENEVLSLINEMPVVNSATPYGSGFFKQDSGGNEKKSMDVILSVDSPGKWHQLNYDMNPWMYSGSGKSQLMSAKFDDVANFPCSIGCFFTDFEGREYKILVVDKFLLYDHLKSWKHFSLAGRFQKEMVLLVDNSNGVLPDLMKLNYRNAVKTGLLMNPERVVSERKLYESIVSLSYLGDLRRIVHMEDPNKIPNIVNGSYDFFKDVYGNETSEYFLSNGMCYKNSGYYRDNLASKIEFLPSSLRNYLFRRFGFLDEYDYNEVANAIRRYFFFVDLTDSLRLMLRCYETVGVEKSVQTFIGKSKKGKIKVKK